MFHAMSASSVHLLVDTGWFHILAIVDRAAIHIGVLVSFQIIISLLFGFIPRSGIAVSCHSSILNFEKPPLFSRMAAPTSFPTNGAQGLPFLHILNNIFHLLSF